LALLLLVVRFAWLIDVRLARRSADVNGDAPPLSAAIVDGLNIHSVVTGTGSKSVILVHGCVLTGEKPLPMI
jgi:hypothetical protein